jgi:hypothetical protein
MTTTCLLGPLGAGRQQIRRGCRSAADASAPIIPRESAEKDDKQKRHGAEPVASDA